MKALDEMVLTEKPFVLMVDDDLGLLDMAGEVLKSDYAVSFAASGPEALELIRGGFIPAIILLDIDMPGMDGFEMLALLREIPQAREVPVVYLTGLTAEEYEERGLSIGAQDYIKKPFSRKILLARLKNCMENTLRLKEKNTLDEEKLSRLAEPLTETELKTLRLLVKGYSNEEIANELFYSKDYVKKLVSRILGKLGIAHRGKVMEFLK